jgi:ATP-dependent DNA helicase RecG
MKIELTSPVSAIPFISDAYSKKFEKLGIYTVKDLLTYFPYRYTENTNLKTVTEILTFPSEEDRYLLRVMVRGMKNIFLRGRHMTLQEGIGYDSTGEIKLSWFNQKFLPETLKPNTEYLLSGKVKYKGKHIIFYPDNYEAIKEGKDIVHLRDFAPEYSLTAGISKKWLRNRIQYLIKHIDDLEIRDELASYGYNLKEGLSKIHFPDDISQVEEAVKQLSFYEFTNIQLNLIEKRNSRKLPPAPEFDKEKALDSLNKAVRSLPFELTEDQQSVLNSLVNKIMNNELIDSMVQGDVGSGKTIIAVLLSLIVAKSGYQVIVLAPTTILAEQHYKNFSNYLGHETKVALITSKTESVDADILIGTTAILSRKDKLINRPGLVIVDEQHKFGVNQREELLKEYEELYTNNFFPHFINMSATPIPRTVIEFIFGEVSVEYIKTKPSGRAEIKTRLFEEAKRSDLIEWVKEKMTHGDRVYWIVPAIESEESNLKNIPIMKEKLMEHFDETEIGILHGKMKEPQKLDTMARFAKGEIKLLLSTSVIEVGIDVPEATVMVVENPERFGLAQLHQIRGRVGRSSRESWCFLALSENMTETYMEKLKFFCETSDGMEISQFDLKNRGPGEIYGTKQSGIPNLKIADFSDFESMMKTKDVAKELYNTGIKEISIFS